MSTKASVVAAPLSAAVPESTLPTLEAIGSAAATAAKRALPYVPRVASAGGTAAGVLLVPGNDGPTYIGLGDGLRARPLDRFRLMRHHGLATTAK